MPARAREMKPPIEMLPLEERIRRRAYELYLRRGNQPGSEIDDWLQAKEEVQSALARKAQFDRMKSFRQTESTKRNAKDYGVSSRNASKLHSASAAEVLRRRM
jgi:DUF2934 family protein